MAGKSKSSRFSKVMADAKKMGIADENSEILINEFLRTSQIEIKRKEEQIQRLLGEIISLKKSADMWHNLVANRVRTEASRLEQEKELEARINKEES